MKLGTENKKQVYILIGLSVVAAYVIYSSFFSGSPEASAPASPTPAPARTTAVAIPGSAPEAEAEPSAPRAPSNSSRSDEFKPKLRSKRPEERVNPIGVDPTLRLDLLAKLQAAPAPGGSHNLFLIAPPPPVQVAVLKGPETIVPVKPTWGPRDLPPPPPPPQPTPPPPPVPINVKYYGWAAPSGSDRKRAFFLDGDDVIVKAEGEPIKGHYRVVKIGPTSVVVVDTNDKKEQTLTKVEESV